MDRDRFVAGCAAHAKSSDSVESEILRFAARVNSSASMIVGRFIAESLSLVVESDMCHMQI